MESNSKFIDEILKNGEAKKELCVTDFEKYLWNVTHRTDKFENVKFNLEDEFENKFNKYCRSYGKSNTVIGEIFRGLSKLMYRYKNDGDDICCGPYSGIWYGLRYELYCPFIHGDNAVEYWDYDYDALSMFSWCGNGYCECMMLNALIIETIDDFQGSNRVDIADYYDNIVSFLIRKDIIEKFKKYDIDITNNFGIYSSRWSINDDNLNINTIDEDVNIDISYRQIQFDFSRSFTNFGLGSTMFKIEFDIKYMDDILKKYGALMKFLIDSTTYKHRYKTREDFESDLDKLGFMIKDRYIVRKELVAEAENKGEEK